MYIHGGLCARWQIYDLISGDKGRLIRQGGGGVEIIQCALTVYRLSTLKKSAQPRWLVEPEHYGNTFVSSASRLLIFYTKQLLSTVGPSFGPMYRSPLFSVVMYLTCRPIPAHCVCIQLFLSLSLCCMYVCLQPIGKWHWVLDVRYGPCCHRTTFAWCFYSFGRCT